MRSKKQNSTQETWTNLKELLGHPLLSGLGTLISLITWVRSDDIWVQVPSAIITIGFGLFFLYIIRLWFQNIAIWLTWKFIIGLVSGIVIGAILMPVLFQPIILNILTVVAPKIEVVDSNPERGGTLQNSISGIIVRFSEPIPWPYYKYVKVEIEPEYPILIEWYSSYQSLGIRPNKIYPASESGGLLNPRFEYGATYHLTISGPMLVKPEKIEIHSPFK